MSKVKKIIPVKAGEKIELTVENMASTGDGIWRYRGYTLFLPDCIAGDKVLARVVKVTPRFGVCESFKTISPSSMRVEPFCSVYFKCGGCQLQCLPYKKQTEFKIGVVKDSLERIGKLKIIKEPLLIPAASPTHYRNKGIFPISHKGGRIKIGFYARGSHDIVDFRDCPVMIEPINQIKEAVRLIIEKHNPSIYNETSHQGLIRNLIIRGSVKEKEFLIGLVTTAGEINKKIIKEMASINEVARGKYRVVGIVQNINTKKTNVVLGKDNRVLWGKGNFCYAIGRIKYQLSLTSFSQVNSFQSEQLNRVVEDMVADTEGAILDAYCGIGNLALWLGAKGRQVTGIEENEEAIKNAAFSAKENRITNCSFIAGTVENFLDDIKYKKEFPVVILNPPRKGCSDEVIEKLLKMGPRKIIYVSCNPASLARDLNKLCSVIYAIKDLSVIDMFPQTIHMETVVLLQNKIDIT